MTGWCLNCGRMARYSPEEALAQSAQIMMHHLKVIAGVDEDWFQSIELPQHYDEDEPAYPPLYDKPIEELDLSVRVFNSLEAHGNYVGGRCAGHVESGTGRHAGDPQLR